MEESELKLYSLGVVIEDKPEGTDFILATPIEVLNIQESGEIKIKENIYKGKLKSLNSSDFITEIRSRNYLRAKWLPFSNSNRITAPDVVEGETVILFKYGDLDEYYWTTIFREPKLRRQETVHYGYSNLKSNKGIESFNKKNSYWMEISTKHKYIKLHTSDNDGELTEYDITIDTKAGNIEIKDKRNNFIKLDSKTNSLIINTNKDLNITTSESVNIKSGKTVNITSPSINISGNVNIKGNIRSLGTSNGFGSNTIYGNLKVNGNIHATGSIIDEGGNSNHHRH